jgi:hypothetical protein
LLLHEPHCTAISDEDKTYARRPAQLRTRIAAHVIGKLLLFFTVSERHGITFSKAARSQKIGVGIRGDEADYPTSDR